MPLPPFPDIPLPVDFPLPFEWLAGIHSLVPCVVRPLVRHPLPLFPETPDACVYPSGHSVLCDTGGEVTWAIFSEELRYIGATEGGGGAYATDVGAVGDGPSSRFTVLLSAWKCCGTGDGTGGKVPRGTYRAGSVWAFVRDVRVVDPLS